jgi:hypothetical protein
MNVTQDSVQRAFESLMLRARTEGKAGPTVAAVAAKANISRSSMYRFHSGIVARIQALSAPKRAAQQVALLKKVHILVRQLKAEKELTKALASACAELAAQQAALTEELEEERLRFQLRVEQMERHSTGKRSIRVIRGGGPA